MKPRLAVLAGVFAAVLFCDAAHAQALRPSTPASAPAKPDRDALMDTEMRAMMEKISAKLSKGPRTEEALAAELKEFDAMLAGHKSEHTDAVARAYFMRVMLYIDVFRDYAKADALLDDIRIDFLGLTASTAANEMLQKLRAAQAAGTLPKPEPGK